MVVEPGLLVHAPGVFSYQQQPAVEVDERSFISGYPARFEPFRAQAQEFAVAADLDGVGTHTVDPGITNLGSHNRQSVAHCGEMLSEIR